MRIIPFLSIISTIPHTFCKQNEEKLKSSQVFATKKNEIETGAQVSTFFVFSSLHQQHHHHYHSTLIPQSGYLFYFSLEFLHALLFLYI